MCSLYSDEGKLILMKYNNRYEYLSTLSSQKNLGPWTTSLPGCAQLMLIELIGFTIANSEK